MEAKTEDTPAEKTIFDAISQGDLTEFKNILALHKGGVDFFDENGMTALQHAAYKGNKDMVQLLLDRVSITTIQKCALIIKLRVINRLSSFRAPM